MIEKELVEQFKKTRDKLKEELRASEERKRSIEKNQKLERQTEIRLKRQIEALGSLITDNTPKEPGTLKQLPPASTATPPTEA